MKKSKSRKIPPPPPPKQRIMVMYAYEGEDGKPREARNDAERQELDFYISEAESNLLRVLAWARAERPNFERWSKDEIKYIADRGRFLCGMADLIERYVLAGDHRKLMEFFTIMLTTENELIERINQPMLDLAKRRYREIEDLPAKRKAATDQTRKQTFIEIKAVRDRLGAMSWDKLDEAHKKLSPEEQIKFPLAKRSIYYKLLNKRPSDKK